MASSFRHVSERIPFRLPVKLRWTQAWCRIKKNGQADEEAKKCTRKVQKFQKAILGMILDDIKKKKTQEPELLQAVKEAAATEAKLRMQKKSAYEWAVNMQQSRRLLE